MAAVGLRVAFLPACPLRIGNGQTEHFNMAQGLFHGFKTCRLDNGDDIFHGDLSL